MKYRKKPVIIEAVQYIKGKEVPAIDFLGGYNINDHVPGNCAVHETGIAIFQSNWADQSVSITIKTLEGNMEVSDGDYIIKGIQGEFYPCKPEIFEQTYEIVEND